MLGAANLERAAWGKELALRVDAPIGEKITEADQWGLGGGEHGRLSAACGFAGMFPAKPQAAIAAARVRGPALVRAARQNSESILRDGRICRASNCRSRTRFRRSPHRRTCRNPHPSRILSTRAPALRRVAIGRAR